MREVYNRKVDLRDTNIKMIVETVQIELEVSQGIGCRGRKGSRLQEDVSFGKENENLQHKNTKG